MNRDKEWFRVEVLKLPRDIWKGRTKLNLEIQTNYAKQMGWI